MNKRYCYAKERTEFRKISCFFEKTLGPQGIKVKSPDYIRGRISKSLREIDISLRSHTGSSEILVIIECRDRKGTEDVTWIEQLPSKREDVGAHKAVAVSSTGFSSGAINMAKVKDIELRTLEEVNPNEILLWFGFKELTVLNYHINFKHVSIKLSVPKSVSVEVSPEVHSSVSAVFDINAPIFVRKKDGNKVSLLDIWKMVPNSIYDDITPGQSKTKKIIRLNFPDEEERFQILTVTGLIDIEHFIIHAEIWIEIKKRPLTSVRFYRDEDKILTKTAEFQLEHQNVPYSLELHKLVESGEQVITIRRKDTNK